MSGPISPNQSFQDRLARLQTSDTAPPVREETLIERVARANVVVEENKKKNRPRPEDAPTSIYPSFRENMRYPMSFVRAFAVGAIAVFAMRLARYHLFADSMDANDLEMAFLLDGALAMVLGFGLKAALALREKELQLAQTVGVVVMLTCMHNLFHWMPGPMGVIFSPQWSEDMVTYSEPNSIYFRGNYFVLGDSGGSGKSAPKVRRG